jgi:beta-galactosidase GanA
MRTPKCFVASLAVLALTVPSIAAEPPRLVEHDGHYALMVDGKPFFVLGGQINNSSSWPSMLPNVWPTLAAMHANTIEAPVYWEQMEPSPGQFDFSTVDALVTGARQHNLRMVLLWFGTWKNGEAHYVPEWIKTHPEKYPRMINERGEPVQVLSANSEVNLEADKTAFRALMHHLHEIDAEQHTVILVQVENESGAINAVRDHSPAAEKEFAGAVPAALVKALGKHAGTWREVFGADADEGFQAYSVAHYISEVAAAGKAEMQLPMYCNVWMDYPHGYRIRGWDRPGFDYPSGGPAQPVIGIWKATATHIDMLGPDIYTSDTKAFNEILSAYDRPDNAVWIPETGLGDAFAKGIFYEMGAGGIGYSPFATDQTGWSLQPGEVPKLHTENYKLLAPMHRDLAQWIFDGKLHTATEEVGQTETAIDLGRWRAEIGFGYPQPDGGHAPGTPDHMGRVLIAQIDPDTFMVAGFDTRVTLLPADGTAGHAQIGHAQILRAEEGRYENGEWHALRILNGDQTDRGINLHHESTVVRVRMGTY